MGEMVILLRYWLPSYANNIT